MLRCETNRKQSEFERYRLLTSVETLYVSVGELADG